MLGVVHKKKNISRDPNKNQGEINTRVNLRTNFDSLEVPQKYSYMQRTS